jgi:hypothetical protein
MVQCSSNQSLVQLTGFLNTPNSQSQADNEELKELPKESRISERNTKQQLKEVVVKFKKKGKEPLKCTKLWSRNKMSQIKNNISCSMLFQFLLFLC